jgi:hypothetical protein
MFGLFGKNKKLSDRSTNNQELELEFRRKDGTYLFSIIGDFARRSYLRLGTDPYLVKTTKNLGPADQSSESKEYVVLKCVNGAVFLFLEHFEVHLDPGDYIKIIAK